MFPCKLCDKIFNEKGKLRRHMIIHATAEFKCEECGKSAQSMSNLTQHKLRVHCDPVFWKHSCHICHQRFPFRGDLNYHLSTHSSIRLECEKCNKQFKNERTRDLHMKNIHSEIKEFICDVCNERFKNERTLKYHQRRKHMNPQEWHFKCDFCGKRFELKQHLERHEVTHERLDCEECLNGFVSEKDLNSHIITRHVVQFESESTLQIDDTLQNFNDRQGCSINSMESKGEECDL